MSASLGEYVVPPFGRFLRGGGGVSTFGFPMARRPDALFVRKQAGS